MRRKWFKKAAALTLMSALLIQPGSYTAGQNAYAAEESSTESTGSSTEYSVERLATGYTKVSADYIAPKYLYKDKVVEYKMDTVLAAEYKSMLAEDNKGYSNGVVQMTVGDKISMNVEVPETALYWIRFDYLSYDDSILPIELSFKVDGEYPFYEARNLKFETTWVTDGQVDLDRYGNEIVTMPEKDKVWESKYLMDASYRYSEPLLVYLTEGSHEFEIAMGEGSVLLGNISLEAPVEVADYTGSPKASGEALIEIEAEDFYERNDSSIHAAGEYDSAVSPVSSKEKVLNILDGDSFKTAGQTITYQFKVDVPGYYYIAMNYRQGDKNDFPVYLDVLIDGQIPSEAFKAYPMDSTKKYKTATLKDEVGEKLSVYLDAGVHTISFTISAEVLRYALEAVDEIMNGINDLSLEVTKVAGTNKDKYRDLKLTRYIPDVQYRLYHWVEQLNSLIEQSANLPGVEAESGDEVAAFAYLGIAAKQLKTLGDEPDELVYRVDELSNSSNSINTQIANFIDIINDNVISIDRIYLYQEDAELPDGLGFFKSMGMSVSRFFYSFFGQSYSATNTDKEHIQVWVNRPRQYVEIMQKMVDEQFTPSTGIEVDLALMTDANKLVLSNASGDTPDIATGLNYALPFELGTRGALVDLTKFDNYKEIFGRYSEGLLVPSVIGDGLYSLPETMNFYVMFYRSDVLEKIGLEIPDTMDDLIAMLPDLQMRGLNVYYQTAPMAAMRNFHGTTPLIFQNGGSLYGETAQELAIGSEASVEGLTQLTELFTLYDLPVDVPNFYQHFRNGDLPIGFADFNAYNLILNAAPEIANSWGIALIPGIPAVDENGNPVLDENGEQVINRYMSGGAESTIMFASNDEREQKAWVFMCWWSSAEVQAEFGQMLQIMYGDEYIWPTANLEAFEMLPFPTSDKEVVLEQATHILEAPRLLGSYMLERELSNVFNNVVVDGENLRSRLDDAIKIVNRETNRKLEEFGYIDSEGNILKEYIVPSVEQVREILDR